jgi:alpha-amylase
MLPSLAFLRCAIAFGLLGTVIGLPLAVQSTTASTDAKAPATDSPSGVYYEIFVRAFADSNGDGIGDLNGITAKLDYLKSLGVSGLWLTPINPSPSYHGYDITDCSTRRTSAASR